MQCELVAWAAWVVLMHIPSMAKHDPRKPYSRFDRFLEHFSPPYYRPEKDKR